MWVTLSTAKNKQKWQKRYNKLDLIGYNLITQQNLGYKVSLRL